MDPQELKYKQMTEPPVALSILWDALPHNYLHENRPLNNMEYIPTVCPSFRKIRYICREQ